MTDLGVKISFFRHYPYLHRQEEGQVPQQVLLPKSWSSLISSSFSLLTATLNRHPHLRRVCPGLGEYKLIHPVIR